MTTLILKGKIVGDTYLFTSHEKSWYKESGWDEEDALDYRIELNDLKEGCQEILAENEKLYENFCEHGNDPEYWENKWIDQFEIEGFLEGITIISLPLSSTWFITFSTTYSSKYSSRTFPLITSINLPHTSVDIE